MWVLISRVVNAIANTTSKLGAPAVWWPEAKQTGHLCHNLVVEMVRWLYKPVEVCGWWGGLLFLFREGLFREGGWEIWMFERTPFLSTDNFTQLRTQWIADDKSLFYTKLKYMLQIIHTVHHLGSSRSYCPSCRESKVSQFEWFKHGDLWNC